MGNMGYKRITRRSENFSEWYNDLIDAADLAEHSATKGCMIIKPYGMALWENIQRLLDERIKKTGASNVYFPLLIPEHFLKREAKHVQGFAPECALVTHAGGEALDEPLIVRPTSETIINDAFSRWIQSWRDLPKIVNQWANVVRWERRPRLFLRTTEFLWQEGHSCHATSKEANAKAIEMLDVYEQFIKECLCIPAVKGVKTSAERFAGALETYTIEALMQDGKALQAGTSHHLGQNFSKSFNIMYADKKNILQYVWQTSWGMSTRLIGAIIMTHGDDQGLVLPPKVAPYSIVMIPISNLASEKKKIDEFVEKLSAQIAASGVSFLRDDRPLRLGEKIYEWEKKGVPLRIEIGPKELEKKQVRITRRDTEKKEFVPIAGFSHAVRDLLAEIQDNLFNRAREFLFSNIVEIDDWRSFEKRIEHSGGFLSCHWCGNSECEAKVKEKTKATIRCIPMNNDQESGKCIACKKSSTQRVIFAKSY